MKRLSKVIQGSRVVAERITDKDGWQTGEGRATPKKMYTITEKGKKELLRQHQIWEAFQADIVFIQNGEEMEHEI